MTRTSLALLAAGAIAAPALADHHTATRDVTAAAEAYNAALVAKDADAMLEHYADDVVVAPPDAERVTGKDAIAEELAEVFATDISFEVELVGVRAATEDGLVYSDSVTTVTMTGEDGASMVVEGTDLHIWEHQDDDSWKIVYDIWNGRPAE